jgi:lipoprotein-anchoring transpeptidase ErfK/SrfK
MRPAYAHLLCVAASAALLFASDRSVADVRPASSAGSAALSELDRQVLLDRAGFSPGEIDGERGKNGRGAMTAFRSAHAPVSGASDRVELLAAGGGRSVDTIVSHTITAEETAGPFGDATPRDLTEQAKLAGLYYTSVVEELGEKFHASPALLRRLNPGARFTVGEEIRVPNVSHAGRPKVTHDERGPSEAHGDGPARSRVGQVKVVVSKNSSAVSVYDARGHVIFHAPVTSGSEHDPLPLGHWVITSIVHNPTYNYNPDLFWDADPTSSKVTIAAGPNNPVGVVWIDLNKPHYGIHGTPEPGRIGHSESHGCVRLTNWDAAELARLVSVGTPVVFQR